MSTDSTQENIQKHIAETEKMIEQYGKCNSSSCGGRCNSVEEHFNSMGGWALAQVILTGSVDS